MFSIVVDNISKSYNSKNIIKALSNVSFSIKSGGELFGLIGPDGAGKTTLFRILTTLLVADEGNAFVDNLDIKTNIRNIREKVGYMPSKFSLYQDLTVEENLRFHANVFDVNIEENYILIKDIYEQIKPFKKRRAGHLSGGMKQKLALCCALIHKPNILFLDEPTTGVDPISRKEFWKILKYLKEQGITIMVSTPYMDEANLCDRIALLQNGKILSIGNPSEIITNYPYKLYQSNTNSYEILNYLKSNKNIELCYISGDCLKVALSDKNELDNIANIQFEEIVPNIEDCFIQLMSYECN